MCLKGLRERRVYVCSCVEDGALKGIVENLDRFMRDSDLVKTEFGPDSTRNLKPL